jgi:hypothetical protein
MKRIIVSLVLIMACYTASNAQNLTSGYNTSLGVKGYFGDGSVGGINVKHFFNNTNAIEASLLFREHFVAVESIYEWHGPINGAQGLKWYAGPGVMLGSYSGNELDHTESDAYFALKGGVGLDYKFTGAPINVAFDLNPTFTLTQGSSFDLFVGIAFRFAF